MTSRVLEKIGSILSGAKNLLRCYSSYLHTRDKEIARHFF